MMAFLTAWALGVVTLGVPALCAHDKLRTR